MSDFICERCGTVIPCDEEDDSWEEDVWGHIQLCHPDLFEEVRDLETPFMLEVCYSKAGGDL